MLTVITVNYGNLEDLEKTIISVDSQTNKNFEHIIVASGLVESSCERIESKYKNKNRTFIFNKDSSLYNAMNLGLKKATRSHVIFMNGGDVFFDERSISEIINNLEENTCLVFRTIQIWKEDFYIRPKENKLSILEINPAHQGFVAPITSKKIFFLESGAINDDTIWMRTYLKKFNYKVSPTIIAKFHLGGRSNYPTIKTVLARRKEGLTESIKEIIKLIMRFSLKDKFYYSILAKKNHYEFIGDKNDGLR